MNAGLYDPELRFLADLEIQVSTWAEQADRHPHAPTRASYRPWWRGQQTLRMTRRTVVLVGLLCLLGATAFGARAVLFPGSRGPATVAQGASVLLAHGRDGHSEWTLEVYVRGGEPCRALVISAQVASSRCGPVPRPEDLDAMSAVSTARRYLFGMAGSNVRAVRIHLGPGVIVAQTQRISPSQAREAGISATTRFFVSVVARPLGLSDQPALVTPLGSIRHAVGPPSLVCVEASPAPCRWP